MSRRNISRPILITVCISVLAGCVRTFFHGPVWINDDRPMVFPQFWAHGAAQADADGGAFDLEGVTLRALSVAKGDLFPRGGDGTCSSQPEAHTYRVIRQADLIFIHIRQDPGYCGREAADLDSDVAYAIRTDGKIMRRYFAGEIMKAALPWLDSDDGGTPISVQQLGGTDWPEVHPDAGADGGPPAP